MESGVKDHFFRQFQLFKKLCMGVGIIKPNSSALAFLFILSGFVFEILPSTYTRKKEDIKWK